MHIAYWLLKYIVEYVCTIFYNNASYTVQFISKCVLNIHIYNKMSFKPSILARNIKRTERIKRFKSQIITMVMSDPIARSNCPQASL